MKRKNFIKTKEDFVCEHCHEQIKGTGYTNHCPNCLYSKHLDLEVPGDRKNQCGGLMEPVSYQKNQDKIMIIHQCQKCGQQTRNKFVKGDNFDALLSLSN